VQKSKIVDYLYWLLYMVIIILLQVTPSHNESETSHTRSENSHTERHRVKKDETTRKPIKIVWFKIQSLSQPDPVSALRNGNRKTKHKIWRFFCGVFFLGEIIFPGVFFLVISPGVYITGGWFSGTIKLNWYIKLFSFTTLLHNIFCFAPKFRF